MSQAIKDAPSKAYAAVRDVGAGIMDLSARGRILVSGKDAAMFLNGLVTNDVKTLAVNSWMPAAFASVQGRLIAAVRIIHREDGFLIDTEAATSEKVLKLVERFTLAGDFQVKNLSNETSLLSVQGRGAVDFIRIEFGRPASHDLERQKVFRTNEGIDVVSATHTAEEGFDIFLDKKDSEYWWSKLIEDGVVPVDEETQELLRIEAGIPRFGIDMDETTLVSETNLDDAVSFTKGCYVGQEIIIRIKHRGHVAKKLTGILFDGQPPLERGTKILSNDDLEIGHITSWAVSPQLERTVAMAYIKFDYLNPETPLKVEKDGATISGVVSGLPLVRGSWNDEQASEIA